MLDIVLLALIAVVAMRFRDQWLEARKREAVMLGRPLKQLPAPPLAPLPKVAPLTAAEYAAVAQQVLFSADRNPTVIVETVAPPPLPPLPVTYGVMNIGAGLTAIMAEKSGAPHIPVQAGGKVGPFTLVRLTDQDMVLEWEGRQVIRKIEELRDHSAPAAQPGANANAARTSPPAQAAAAPDTKVSAIAQNGPMGVTTGGGYNACVAGDKTPAGTIVDGHKKVVHASPFGEFCNWAPVQ